MVRKLQLRAAQARKIPHPNHEVVGGLNKLSLLINCADMPTDIPFDPNPRTANDRSRNKKVYRQVRDSLLGIDGAEAGFFDLKNRGIVIIAKSATFLEKDEQDRNVFELDIPEDYGLADGGHTFDIIAEVNRNPETREKLKILNQYVEIRVIEIPNLGEAESLIAPVAKGLNTSVQVDDMSIANLDKKFENLKKRLNNEFSAAIAGWPKKHDYEHLFGWEQTDVSYIDAKEMMTIASTLDVSSWKDTPAVQCYSSPATVFGRILKQDAVDRFENILPDILKLYNQIQFDFPAYYNELFNGHAGKLAFVDHKKVGEYIFPFIGQTNSNRLMKGASLPILSAFKIYVNYDESTDRLNWKHGFEEVLEAWQKYHAELVSRTVEGAQKHRRNVANAIGKDATHWQSLRDGLLLKSMGL